MQAPDLPHDCNSWVVVRKADGVPVLETWNRALVERVDAERFDVFTALAWLQQFNRSILNAD